MALLIFNFDGTGNEPEDAVQQLKKGKKEDDNITNILKLHLMFGGHLHTDDKYGSSSHDTVKRCFYYQGVGTYGNWWQRIYNQGLAPESKNVATILKKAYQDFEENYEDGDQLLVTGFSRGAAIARRFCAKLREKSGKVDHETAPFVYLAVFDTVASIGLPNLSKSERPDYDVVFEDGCTLCDSIVQATHMVSLDDKRKAFQPTLMNFDESRIQELWFAGAHSDVGGGYYRDGLSDVALTFCLNWIAEQVKFHGLIDPKARLPAETELTGRLPNKLGDLIGLDDVLREANPLGKNHQQDRWPVLDWLTLEDRLCCVIENDKVSKRKPVLHHAIPIRIAKDGDYRPKSLRNIAHQVWYSFTEEPLEGAGVKGYINNPRPQWFELAQSESVNVTAYAAELFNHTGVLVEEGEVYSITVAATESWSDASIQCDADGWNADEEDLGWKKMPVKLARRFRRIKSADWFVLCATVGRDDNLARPIGLSDSYTVPQSGELTLFANDIKSKMGNNYGFISVTITRIE